MTKQIAFILTKDSPSGKTRFIVERDSTSNDAVHGTSGLIIGGFIDDLSEKYDIEHTSAYTYIMTKGGSIESSVGNSALRSELEQRIKNLSEGKECDPSDLKIYREWLAEDAKATAAKEAEEAAEEIARPQLAAAAAAAAAANMSEEPAVVADAAAIAPEAQPTAPSLIYIEGMEPENAVEHNLTIEFHCLNSNGDYKKEIIETKHSAIQFNIEDVPAIQELQKLAHQSAIFIKTTDKTEALNEQRTTVYEPIGPKRLIEFVNRLRKDAELDQCMNMIASRLKQQSKQQAANDLVDSECTVKLVVSSFSSSTLQTFFSFSIGSTPAGDLRGMMQTGGQPSMFKRAASKAVVVAPAAEQKNSAQPR